MSFDKPQAPLYHQFALKLIHLNNIYTATKSTLHATTVQSGEAKDFEQAASRAERIFKENDILEWSPQDFLNTLKELHRLGAHSTYAAKEAKTQPGEFRDDVSFVLRHRRGNASYNSHVEYGKIALYIEKDPRYNKETALNFLIGYYKFLIVPTGEPEFISKFKQGLKLYVSQKGLSFPDEQLDAKLSEKEAAALNIVYKIFCDHQEIEARLKKFAEDFIKAIRDEKADVFKVFAEYYLRYIAIHPFRDYNARVFKIILNGYLTRRGYDSTMLEALQARVLFEHIYGPQDPEVNKFAGYLSETVAKTTLKFSYKAESQAYVNSLEKLLGSKIIKILGNNRVSFAIDWLSSLDEKAVQQLIQELGFDGSDQRTLRQVAPQYSYHTKQHYKIWFSDNPNSFMDMENQLRLITAVKTNPGVSFTLIYSARCLNAKSREALKAFCSKYRITPLDFDTEIRGMIREKQDIDLYKLAEQEIIHTLKKQGGSFASASDIIRLIVPVIERCWIYDDTELELNFSPLPDVISRPAPFIVKMKESKDCASSVCNDRLAFPFDKANPKKLNEYSESRIRSAQRKLLQAYQDPLSAILKSEQKDVPMAMERECAFSAYLTRQFFSANPRASMFEWKKFAQEASFSDLVGLFSDAFYAHYFGRSARGSLSVDEMKKIFGTQSYNEGPAFYSKFNAKDPIELTDLIIRLIKHRLFSHTVLATSGPNMIHGLFEEPTEFTPQTFMNYMAYMKQCSTLSNFDKAYRDRPYVEIDHPLANIGNRPSSEQSWTMEGRALKQARLHKLESTAIWLQDHRRKLLEKRRGTLFATKLNQQIQATSSPTATSPEVKIEAKK